MSDLSKAALWYARKGWPVFPLHSPTGDGCSCGRTDCSSPAKHPRTQYGLKDATTDPERIATWWGHTPDANIGLATGRAAGLFVLDVDPNAGGFDSLAELVSQIGRMPETPISLTGGGGEHYLFAYPSVPLGNSAGRLGPGLDTRGEGGYIVAPPSRHISGHLYAWEASALPTTRLAPVPVALLALLAVKRQQAAPEVLGPIYAGARDNTLASMAGSMRRRGMSESAITAALAVENERCVPPLSPEDIVRIARSVSRYAVPSTGPLTTEGGTNNEEITNRTRPDASVRDARTSGGLYKSPSGRVRPVSDVPGRGLGPLRVR